MLCTLCTLESYTVVISISSHSDSTLDDSSLYRMKTMIHCISVCWKWKCVQSRKTRRRVFERMGNKTKRIAENTRTYKCGWYLYSAGNENQKKDVDGHKKAMEMRNNNDWNTLDEVEKKTTHSRYWKDVTADRYWMTMAIRISSIRNVWSVNMRRPN